MNELRRVPVKAFIDGRLVELSPRVLNYEKFEKLGCRPVIYPQGLCCEKSNKKAEWIEICDKVRLFRMYLDAEPMIPMIEKVREFLELCSTRGGLGSSTAHPRTQSA